MDVTSFGIDPTQLARYKVTLDQILKDIPLDLTGIRVLTEAATGNFTVTSILSAVAGAEHVVAIGGNSRYGTFQQVKEQIDTLSEYFGVSGKITLSDKPGWNFAKESDLVTNLRFVRPISRNIIRDLPKHAAVSLMWAPWEFRAGDIDLEAAYEFDIPIVATNEDHPSVSTFHYVGVLAAKLLLDDGHSIFRQKIAIIGSNPFGKEIAELLSNMGAIVRLVDPTFPWQTDHQQKNFSPQAIVVAEHRAPIELLGENSTGELGDWIIQSIPIIHICGNIDVNYLRSQNCSIYPKIVAPFGFMSATTGELGLEPVARLHAAGLLAGSNVIRAKENGKSTQDAIETAIQSGFGMQLSRVQP